MTPPKDSLLLIDGHALLYRAFHALPPLQTKEGISTHAVYGFITTLFKALDDIQPKYCAVAFDLAGATFRHEAFEGYKANRPSAPDDLKTQIPYAYEVTKALNIPIFTAEGYEADDVIGTLAKQAKTENVPVVIVTGDKDSFQLVNESTFVYIMRRSLADTVLYDKQGVFERMGIFPAQVPDFKALAGDQSDEIPGINGIGEKTAVTILKAAPTIDELYQKLKNGDEIPGILPRIREKLITGEAIARKSRELAEIHTSVPITLKLEECLTHDFDPTQVAEVFQKLEFFSLLKRLPTTTIKESTHAQTRTWTFETIVTQDRLEALVENLMSSEILAVDTETDGLKGVIIGMSLANSPDHGYYIPFIKEHGAELAKEALAHILRPLLEAESIKKVGHNIKYDIHIIRQLGITLEPIAFDTMVAAYLLHAHLRTFDFDSVCQRELNYIPISFADVAGSTKKTATLVQAEGEKVAEYAAEDAILTFRLYHHFGPALAKEPKLLRLAQEVDFPLIPVLAAMEEHGLLVDCQALVELDRELDQEIIQVKKAIEHYANEPININSPAQLQKLLFEDLGLAKHGIKTTQSGFSTAAQELEKLQGLHPIVDTILRYRELTKLQNTYVKTLPLLADDKRRIHTQFSQTTAATGRLASSEPNLQNIPIRTDLGNKIRQAFVAPEGYELLSLDYSQFELRIIAHLSGDRQLQQVFLDQRDIHDEVAKKLGIDRRAAKAINFGIIYGLSAYGLSQGLKIDPKVAREYIDAYFASYPDLARYLEKTKEEIRTQGYVETLFGRRREIPEIHASNAIVRAQAERMAINAPAQGTEADLIKLAMIQVHAWLKDTYVDQKAKPTLILQVHDSLLLEVPDGEINTVASHVKQIMESVHHLTVPLIVDCSYGKTWGALEKMA